MTLDEAIEHAREKAEEQRKDYDTCVVKEGYGCKDCKHWGTGAAGEIKNIKCCEYGKYMVGANGYCVYGEKKESVE